MVGCQFTNVGDGTDLDINQLLTSDNLAGFDAEYTFQSEILKWTGAGYDSYGWCADGQGTENQMPEWDGTWLLSNMSDLASDGMSVGNGVWIRTAAPATVTFSGEVVASDTYSVSVSAGLSMICNPFPTAISIQKIKSDNLVGFDAEYTFQSEILKWTGTGYDLYGWCADGQGTENQMPEWDGTWLLSNMSDLANVTIGVGEAVWIRTIAPATLTFTK